MYCLFSGFEDHESKYADNNRSSDHMGISKLELSRPSCFITSLESQGGNSFTMRQIRKIRIYSDIIQTTEMSLSTVGMGSDTDNSQA